VKKACGRSWRRGNRIFRLIRGQGDKETKGQGDKETRRQGEGLKVEFKIQNSKFII
jgi:hypothetical protein